MRNHEYSVIQGLDSVLIIRTLTIFSGLLSTLSTFVFFKFVDKNTIGLINQNILISIFVLISSGSFFSMLYWLFNNFLWKSKAINKIIKNPNLNGTWLCNGETLSDEVDLDNQKWNSKIVIHQLWDKIKIRFESEQSSSTSISVTLLYDEGIGYRLLYHYRNDPNIRNMHLRSHIGFAEIIFSEDLGHAEGMYFNGKGRKTFGAVKLEKL